MYPQSIFPETWPAGQRPRNTVQQGVCRVGARVNARDGEGSMAAGHRAPSGQRAGSPRLRAPWSLENRSAGGCTRGPAGRALFFPASARVCALVARTLIGEPRPGLRASLGRCSGTLWAPLGRACCASRRRGVHRRACVRATRVSAKLLPSQMSEIRVYTVERQR